MGNSVYTGHVLTACGFHQVLGFESSAKALINFHGIEPWNARSLIKDNLLKQGELARRSPLRMIPVEEGLKFMRDKTSGWFQSGLTKEQFVQCCCLLLGKQQIPYQPADRDDLYSIFDAMDFDRNESLSVGEWAAGLSVFFKGSTEQAVHAVFTALDKDNKGAISKKELKEYLQPFVKAMSPTSAAALRPLLEAKAVDDIYNEMDMDHDSSITSDEMIAWTKKGNSIVDKLADIIDKEVYEIWLRENQKRRKQQGLDGTLSRSFRSASPGSWGSPTSYPAQSSPQGQCAASPSSSYGQGQAVYGNTLGYGPSNGYGPSQSGPNPSSSSASPSRGPSPSAFGQASSPSQSSVGGWLKGFFGATEEAQSPSAAARPVMRDEAHDKGYDDARSPGGARGAEGMYGRQDAGYHDNAAQNRSYDGQDRGRSPDRRPPPMQQRDPFADEQQLSSVPPPPPPPARGARGPPSASFSGVPAPPSYNNSDYGGGYGPPPRSSAPYGGYGR